MNKNDVTIILATSVLPSHPDKGIADRMIASTLNHYSLFTLIIKKVTDT